MDEQTQIIMVGVISCLSCWVGYALGQWQSRRNFATVLRTLIDMSRKGKSNEAETSRTKNKNETP